MNSERKMLKRILSMQNKPLFGNNRSFSNIATRRAFKVNSQTISFGAKKFSMPRKFFRTYWINLKKSL